METVKNDIKVGLIGVGLDTYWGQFEGLLPRLTGYRDEIAGQMSSLGATVVNAGMVDNPQKALSAAEQLNGEDVELLFIFISTYALSSTVLPVAQRVKAPVILLNIQPVAAIDYDYINGMGDSGKMTGEWLAHCQACSAPEFACVFNRAGIQYDIVTG
ncbi:MAG: arabinose isomerase, partial [Prevotellaceae bacterium]|nr:arabinose isomerase [Prevotellaceae bacterium]